MEEGKILIAKEWPGSDRYRVDTDCFSGTMQYVGVVWSSPPWSTEAKRKNRKDWWARHAGPGNSEVGPFESRKAAAGALCR